MATESALRAAGHFRLGGILCLLVAVILGLFVALTPIDVEADLDALPAPRLSAGSWQRGEDPDPLIREIAGRRLIRPAQIQAAVKDSGIARKLLKRLRLEGVIKLGGRFVAYVHVEKEGTKTVVNGDTILGFLVEDVLPGRVTLSLEGVRAELSH